MQKRRTQLMAVSGVAALALGITACGGSSGGGTGGNNGGTTSSLSDCNASPKTCNSGPVKKGGTLVFALEKNIAGWSELNAQDNTQDYIYALNGIYPWVTITEPDGSFQYNADVVSSYKLTNTNPETITIDINPKATWDDGTPVTADDFQYAWEIQNPATCPKCAPATTAGFDQIKSITGSNGGKTATVVFSKVYPDWQGLFQNLLPSHIAAAHENMSVTKLLSTASVLADSFNNFFVKTRPTWSMGPYKIQSWQNNGDLVEVPNPKWWGGGANFDKLVFHYTSDATQEPLALKNNEVQVIFPQPEVDLVQNVQSIPGVESAVESGLQWEHFDFNFKNKYLGKYKALRQALFTAIDRNGLITRTVGQFDPNVKPLNNHMFVPTQSAYVDNSASGADQGSGNLDAAKKLLTDAGFTGVGTGLKAPDGSSVPTFRIRYTTGNAIREQECELFKAAAKSLGVNIKIQTTDDLGGTLAGGDFDIIVFAWVDNPFPVSGAYQIFTTGQGGNYGYYSNPKVDRLLRQAASSTDQTKNFDLLNQADKLLWADAYNLPLYQKPVFLALYKNYKNIRPNAGSIGFSYNIKDWGLSAS